jgi:hypothetical protein
MSTSLGTDGEIEVIERHEEPYSGAVFGDQVLKHEEFDVPFEVLEQREEVAVPCQRLTEWAALGEVVPPDALECEIEPVLDLPIEAAGAAGAAGITGIAESPTVLNKMRTLILEEIKANPIKTLSELGVVEAS